MNISNENKIKDVCPEHGQISSCIVKQLPCGHEDYNMQLPLVFCPYCGQRLKDMYAQRSRS